jgi:hypothetical protein
MSKYTNETSEVLSTFCFSLGIYFLFILNKFNKICLHVQWSKLFTVICFERPIWLRQRRILVLHHGW